MRRSASALVILLLGVVACTDEQPRQEPASRSATSPSASSVVVPDVLGENFLEALVAADPPFRLLDVRYRASSDVPNGTILTQRPAAGSPIDSSEPEIVIRVVVSTSPR
jgi:beta-lactam-binding protein with PASTA domain